MHIAVAITSEHRYFRHWHSSRTLPPLPGRLNRLSIQQQYEFSIGHRRRGTGVAEGVCEVECKALVIKSIAPTENRVPV